MKNMKLVQAAFSRGRGSQMLSIANFNDGTYVVKLNHLEHYRGHDPKKAAEVWNQYCAWQNPNPWMDETP